MNEVWSTNNKKNQETKESVLMKLFFQEVRHHPIAWPFISMLLFTFISILLIFVVGSSAEASDATGVIGKITKVDIYYGIGIGAPGGYAFAQRTSVAAEKDKNKQDREDAEKWRSLLEENFREFNKNKE